MDNYLVDSIVPLVIHVDPTVQHRQQVPTVGIHRILSFLLPQEISSASLVSRRWQLGVSVITSHSCGNKHDNLLKAKLALSGGIASIPSFFGWTDAQIRPLLGPETRALWQEVCQKGCLIFYEQSTDLLAKLQASVEHDILAAQLPLSSSQRRMLVKFAGETLIVRSSSNEDAVDAVNAGGNESVQGVAATEASVRQALAKVVASYFSLQSLKNRSAGANPFQQLPACSALLMIQIVEKANDSHPIVSGVLVTHKTSWFRQREGRVPHIVASYGFGGGVVAGKIPSDEWVLTDEQWLATIRSKRYRLALLPSGNTQQVENPLVLRNSPCLTEAQLRRLQAAGRSLEEYFGQPMDVEFVFQGDELFVVQARHFQAPEMRNPSFLDLQAVPATDLRFQGTTLLPGTGEVLRIYFDEVVFSESLEEADGQYEPERHKAVFIYRAPCTSNTHPEVNLSSQRPPIPCILLSREAWETCVTRTGSGLHLCPQRGLVVISSKELPICRGLIQHPARLTISVDGSVSPYQSAHATQRWIAQVKSYLQAIEERIAGLWDAMATKEDIRQIEACVSALFKDIAGRTAAQTGEWPEVLQRFQSMTSGGLNAMQRATDRRHLTLLSFFSGVIKQLLQQIGRQVVGAHSLAGLDTATQVSACLESFLKRHLQSPLLFALALSAKKAWDEPIQESWLHFLETHRQEMVGETGKELLAQIRRWDALGLTSLWLSIHFSGDAALTPQQLLVEEAGMHQFLERCLEFSREWQSLADRGESVRSIADLTSVWEVLQSQSMLFFKFCSEHLNRNLLQTLQLSRISYDLIQLWDSQVKLIKTSRLLSEEETRSVYKQRIHLFAAFGLQAIEAGVIAMHLAPMHRSQLQGILREIQKRLKTEGDVSYRKAFSVQHWIVPKSRCAPRKFPNDDVRFSIVHQNLLRAATLPLTPDLLALLPRTLANAVKTFQSTTVEARRHREDSAEFLSLQDESAAVTFNIPLNIHSFVLTIQQNRGSEALEFQAFWKGNDNCQGGHLPFIQLLCFVAGIGIKSTSQRKTDLQVCFLAADTQQVSQVCRAIHRINSMSLGCKSYFSALAWVLHPRPEKLEGLSYEKAVEEMRETRTRVVEAIWTQLVNTGTLPDFICHDLGEASVTNLFSRRYLEEKGALSMVVTRVIEELEGKCPASAFSERFFDLTFETLSEADKKELIWNVLASGREYRHEIPRSHEAEIIKRLYCEKPGVAHEYFSSALRTLSAYELLMQIIVVEGSPSTLEQAKVLSVCVEVLLLRYGKTSEAAVALLEPWKTQL